MGSRGAPRAPRAVIALSEDLLARIDGVFARIDGVLGNAIRFER